MFCIWCIYENYFEKNFVYQHVIVSITVGFLKLRKNGGGKREHVKFKNEGGGEREHGKFKRTARGPVVVFEECRLLVSAFINVTLRRPVNRCQHDKLNVWQFRVEFFNFFFFLRADSEWQTILINLAVLHVIQARQRTTFMAAIICLPDSLLRLIRLRHTCGINSFIKVFYFRSISMEVVCRYSNDLRFGDITVDEQTHTWLWIVNAHWNGLTECHWRGRTMSGVTDSERTGADILRIVNCVISHYSTPTARVPSEFSVFPPRDATRTQWMCRHATEHR